MKLFICPSRTAAKDKNYHSGKSSDLHENLHDRSTPEGVSIPVTFNYQKPKQRCFSCHTTKASSEISPRFGNQVESDGYTKLFLIAPLLIWLFISSIPIKSFGQKAATRMLRVYMDNDFFAYQKQDGAYTNGIRLDYFYQNKNSHPSSPGFYLNAGAESESTSSIGAMQIMITPNDILERKPAKDDYPYSGSLFLSHTVNSINAVKNKAVKTEYIVGLVGPKSYAGETQTFVHRVLNFSRPVGWNSQYRTNIFANVNISAERLLFSKTKGFEIIAGGELDMGTLQNSAAVHSTIRAGKMTPYFGGYINQYTSYGKSLIAYIFVTSQLQYVLHNTILEGTTLNNQTDTYRAGEFEAITGRSKVSINHQLFAANAGVVVAYHGFGLSATYTHEAGLLQHQPAKGYGNVSLYIGL